MIKIINLVRQTLINKVVLKYLIRGSKIKEIIEYVCKSREYFKAPHNWEI